MDRRVTAAEAEGSQADLVRSSGDLAIESLRKLLAGLEGGGCKAKDDLPDPLGLQRALWSLYARLLSNPAVVAEAQWSLWRDYLALYAHTSRRLLGLDSEPVAEPERDDRRFRDSAWDENAVFDLVKQSYLITSRSWMSLLGDVEGLDEKTRRKLEFATQQMIDALSPSNFAHTNPEVIRETVSSGGRNLVEGLKNLLDDLDTSGRLNISMTDMDAFEVGVDLAVTPGKVVFQNELLQLIQYAPTTEEVHRRPLLLVPPWMNKYYVMDLRPGNSMVQWLVDQGHTVFIVSWVNPDSSLADKSFEDYLVEGLVAAIDAIEKATGEREVNVAGYCLGGILLAAAVAWMQAKGDDRIRSATYLTTMVDFSDVGDVDVFIDEEGLPALEQAIEKRGFLSGRAVADTWRAVRANDLIWSFFVNSYLLGNSPQPFDILHWNCDSTNMPAAMHTFFMRNMYLENRLREPGGVTLAGVPIDVTKVETPAYVLATREDHISPWKTAYETTQLFKGPMKFVLGASGHIAGVINPPQRNKYGYWTNSKNPPDAEAWLEAAREHEGSWWPDWARWLKRYAGGEVDARVPGAGGLPAIEDAPGTYVLRKMPEC